MNRTFTTSEISWDFAFDFDRMAHSAGLDSVVRPFNLATTFYTLAYSDEEDSE